MMDIKQAEEGSKDIQYHLFLQVLQIIPITSWFSIFVGKGKVHYAGNLPEPTHSCYCLLDIHPSMRTKMLSLRHETILTIACNEILKLRFEDFNVLLQARNFWSLFHGTEGTRYRVFL